MNALERLRDSMFRVGSLVDFYKQSPTITLDTIDFLTKVTMEDLNVLLHGLEDRDISLHSSKRPKFKTPREIERDAKLAKIIVEEEDEREAWIRGYGRGYKGGYKEGMKKGIEYSSERELGD